MAVLVTAIFASLYVVGQQLERQGADDGPGRLASQVAAQLAETGEAADSSPSPAAGADVVDIARSDEPFFVIYDSANHPISGTGLGNGRLPTVPTGVLDVARHSGSNHVTWQTANGRRFATVERRAGNDVVLAAQSLTPTEARIDQLGLLVLVAWLCVLAVVVVAFLIERAVATLSRRAQG
jgi:hypothetical protein